jgi:hypothetical protein
VNAKEQHFGLGPSSFEGQHTHAPRALFGESASRVTSKILETLGGRTAVIRAVHLPEAKVVWFNFELARRLGLEVPEGDRLTPEFHQAVIDALAFRAIEPGEESGFRATTELFADAYGGTYMGEHQGSGRFGFFDWGGLGSKGIGLTPLAKPRPHDFQHSHGGAPMIEGGLEAIFGDVNASLFSLGSTQTLAVLDTGAHTHWPDGARERRALIIRAGPQFRPAHLLKGPSGGSHAFSEAAFLREAKASGLLVVSPATGEPDLHATMLHVIDAHAEVSAQQVRWRMTMGGLSTSNMTLRGAQIDLATQSSQPGTAPVKTSTMLDKGEGTFGFEHKDRAYELDLVYQSMTAGLSSEVASAHNAKPIDVNAEMNRAYRRHLELALVGAAGLKPDHALRLTQEAPKVTGAFRRVVKALMELKNPGDANIDKVMPRELSTVDVFALLEKFPKVYFKDPEGQHVSAIKALLAPAYRSLDPARQDAKVDALCRAFGEAYRALMRRAQETSGPFHLGPEAFKRSVVARAAFENRPLEALYRPELKARLAEAIWAYESGRDPTFFRELVDGSIAASARSVEGLLTQGQRRRNSDGTLELEARTVGGIDYSLRVQDGAAHLRVELPLDGDDVVGYRLSTIPGAPTLSPTEAQTLRFRFTTDAWKSLPSEMQSVIARNARGRQVLAFTAEVATSTIAHLEGAFFARSDDGERWIKAGDDNFRGYAFAVPDRHEVGVLGEAISRDRSRSRTEEERS